jgi:2-methylcitrate dehydratase PrpD
MTARISNRIPRRAFVGAVAASGLVGQVKAAPATTPAPPDVTRILARWIIGAKYEALPQPVRREALRTMLNWTGCAVGGARHETLDIALRALSPFAGAGQATVLGRKERLDVMHAALMNGISSHSFDYDDTHLRTLIHPAGPVASALLSLSEYHPVSGREFLNALVVGVETECRIGNAVYPAHYDIGWHITGTVGPFGAAAAVGKVLGLNEQQMVWALGLAAVQPVGLKEMFGSMTKSFHPGRAAQNGLTAAFLASKNYTSSDHGLEAKTGWANVLSTERKWDEMIGKLGETYQISLNTYKPYACGVVNHPAIEGAILLREMYKLTADQIKRIDLLVNPLVAQLTGNKNPQTGLEGKFSIYHATAVALDQGAAGEKQFSDALVQDPKLIALRGKVTATVDKSVHEDQVNIAITLRDGRRFEMFVEHVTSSLENPMRDAQLETKFLDLADGVIPPAQAKRLMGLCWDLEELESAADIAKAGAAV